MGFRKGTGFTNLNKVITANRGNKLGSTVAGGISAQNQGVNTGVQTSQQKFQEEAQKNRLDTDESKNKREEILGRFTPVPSSGTGAVTPPATPAANTSTVAPPATPATPATPAVTPVAPVQSPVSDQEINDFTRFRTGTYAGPKELEDVDSLYGKAQQAEQSGDLSRSSGGRQELLRRFVGGNGYTQGQRQLDETILGQDAEGVRGASKMTRGATDRVSQANSQAGSLAKEYIGRARQFGQETGQRIQETKNPFNSSLDTRVSQAQDTETKRQSNIKAIQDLIAGRGTQSEGIDSTARLGLGLQDALDQGYISNEESGKLLGGNGLIARGQEMGLDLNSLVGERLRNTAAQNIGRTGVATDDEIAKLNALDRLSGKQGSDLEFLNGQGKYAAGSSGLDLGSLDDFISRTEKEKGSADKATADKIEARRAQYANQAIAGGQQIGEGAGQTAGALLNQFANPSSYYDPGQVGQNINNSIQGSGKALAGGAKMADNVQNSFLEGLTKLNIGGKSLADTEGGRQLLKAIELKNQVVNQTAGAGQQALGRAGTGIQDLLSGNFKGALGNLSGANTLNDMKGMAGDHINKIGKALGKIKIKKPKIRISDENLKTEIDYSDKDVQNFMDRLKPASYNYKDEVKDDPRASRDRQLGVMAQDLEKSKLGKEAVHEEDIGKVVDYEDLQPKMLASLAALNRRLNKMEGKE